MSRDTEAEIDEIVRALDSMNFDAKLFTDWLRAKSFEMLDPYRGVWSYKGRHGVVSFVMRALGGPTRVEVCNYTPTGAKAINLVSGGRSRSGKTFPPAEIEFLRREAAAEVAKPLEQKVMEIIADAAEVPRGEVTSEMSLEDDLWALEVEDLAIELEAAFDCKIPSEDAEQFKTVGDVVSYMKRRLRR
jgi:acyl carrier protein